MKKTVFYDDHVRMGGRMVEFAGFQMPVEFSGVKNEHIAVRKSVGVFDVSHMGEIWIEGEESAAFVQRMTSNDVNKLVQGKIQYSCFPNGKGGIVDDLLVYMVDYNTYLLVVNASNIKKDWDWLNANVKENVVLRNASDATSQLAVQGPNAIRTLRKLTDLDLDTIPYYTFQYTSFAGKEHVLLSNTGYTGSGGFELYFSNEDGPDIMNAIMEAGKEFDIVPAGLASRDTLRLESGFCLYGNDIDDASSPLEAGLGWITKFTDGNDFIDREYLEKQKEAGLQRRLVGFELLERGIPRKGYPILDAEAKQIGEVRSGTMSPLTSKSIGMGYVAWDYRKEGTEIFIGIRNKQLRAKIVRPPFFEK